MKQPKLDTIIKLNELKDYLSNQDLIKLSLSCKHFRKLLSPEVLSSFNFWEFTINGKYKSSVSTVFDKDFEQSERLYNKSRDDGDKININEHDTGDEQVGEDQDYKNEIEMDEEQDEGERSEEEVSETEDGDNFENYSDEDDDFMGYTHNPYKPQPKSYLESKVKFRHDLKKIANQPTKLKVMDIQDYEYLLYDLPSIFFNLQSLTVKSSCIQLEVFQYLLDHLHKLTAIELVNCTLNKQKLDENNYTVNWPKNLIKLVTGDNIIGLIDDNLEYLKKTCTGYIDTNYSNFTLSPKNIQSLYDLSLKRSNNRGVNNDLEFMEFLKKNSHIKELNISIKHFNLGFLEVIRKFNNLSKLKLSICYCEDNSKLNSIQNPIIPSLKYLYISLDCKPSIIQLIPEQFPNITNLKLNLGFIHIIDLNQSILMLQRFKLLKNLKLEFYLTSGNVKDIKFLESDSIARLELCYNNSCETEDFNSYFETCKNLKIIKIEKQIIIHERLFHRST